MTRLRPRYRIGLLALACLSGAAGAQTPRLRDSSGVRIIEYPVPPGREVLWRRVDSLPLVAIGGPGTQGNAALGTVSGATRLADGSVVIADRDHKRLSVFDARGAYRYGIDVSGSGIGAPGLPWGVLPLPGQRIAAWDAVSNRLTIVGASGRITGGRHLDNPPDERTDHGGWARRILVLLGAFANGDILARAQNTVGLPSRQVAPESTLVYRVDAKGRLSLLGNFLRMERFGFTGRYVVGGPLPLGRNGSFAAGADKWFYADGAGFEITRHAPTGTVTGRIRVLRDPEPVTPDLIRRLSRARLERSEPDFRRDDSLALEWMPFPRVAPGYVALRTDPAGNVWARRWTIPGGTATWEVFGDEGQWRGVVLVPGDLEMLEIGTDYLLARYTRNPRFEEIRVYRLRAAR